MSPVLVTLLALALLAAGYLIYSKFLEQKIFRVREDEPVPAIEHADEVDFVATKREVLWGHHFSSIAGAAPILGPAMAIIWGWLPALIWIVFGVIFMGAAHDFGALVLSMRHGGKSVGSLAEGLIGPRSRVLFLLVIFFLIWLVGAVFAFAITNLFLFYPASILPVNLEIAVAVLIGWFATKRGVRLLIPSLLALVGLYLVIFGTASGTLWVPTGDSIFLSKHFWLVALMVYAFVASSLPVWVLLQPRDLINSHQLVVGLSAMYLGFFVLGPEFQAPAVGELRVLPHVFPVLMVTIACGSISGFHGLVSSGTTSKQLGRARDARSIGYGAMLVEAALAILATMALASGLMRGVEHGSAWNSIKAASLAGGHSLPSVGQALNGFVHGAASFLEALAIPYDTGRTVVAVLVISFAATSLDTALRIQRMVLGELGATYRIKPLQNRWFGGALACGSVLVLIYADFDAGAKSLWPVFGATNQVLAALTLLLCALYLRKLGRRSLPYALPAVFIMCVTFLAMFLQVKRDLLAEKWLVACVGIVIGVLTSWVAIEGALAWRRTPPSPSQGPTK